LSLSPTPSRLRAGEPTTRVDIALIAAALLLPLLLAVLITRGGHELRVVVGIVAVVAIVASMARPFFGLVLFIGLLYVRPEDSFPVLTGMRLTLIVSMVTLGSMLVQRSLHHERLRKTPLNVMLGGFALALVLSTWRLGTISDALEAAQDVGKLAILVLLVVNVVRTPREYRALITVVLLCTLYVACYSLYLYNQGGAMASHEGARSQAVGLFANPNDLAVTLAAGAALVISRLLHTRGLMRLVYVGAGAVMCWAVFLTQSRGGLLALVVVCVISVLFNAKNRKLALVAAIVLGLGLVGAASGRMTNFDTQEESAGSRFEFWANAIDLFVQNPVTGVGYQQFAEYNHGYLAHNSFVQCFVELGFLGYFFWVGIIYFCFRDRMPPPDPTGRDRTSADVLAARLSLAGYLAGCFSASRTYSPVLFLLFSLPVAALMVAVPRAPEEGERPAPIWREYAMIGLICIGIMIVVKALVMLLG
jgi:putative inorganic carbon (HCO3(-)) transporter